jgi:hypothetical protein
VCVRVNYDCRIRKLSLTSGGIGIAVMAGGTGTAGVAVVV